MKEDTNKDEESCFSCLKFKSNKQRNEKDDKMDEDDDILSSIKLLFCREALEVS